MPSDVNEIIIAQLKRYCIVTKSQRNVNNRLGNKNAQKKLVEA